MKHVLRRVGVERTHPTLSYRGVDRRTRLDGESCFDDVRGPRRRSVTLHHRLSPRADSPPRKRKVDVLLVYDSRQCDDRRAPRASWSCKRARVLDCGAEGLDGVVKAMNNFLSNR